MTQEPDTTKPTKARPQPRCATLKDFIPVTTSNAYQTLSKHNEIDSDDDDDDDEDKYEPNEEKKTLTGKGLSRNQRKKEAARKLRRSLHAMQEEDNKLMKAAEEENHHEEVSHGGEEPPPVPCYDEDVVVSRKSQKSKVRFMTKPTEAAPTPCLDGCCNLSRPDVGDLDQSVNLFEYQQDEELNAVFEEVEVEVANDSGSCAHVVGRDQVPSTVEVRHTPDCKNFTGAGGDGIKNHGKAEVTLVTEDGKTINNVVQVADVTRALHSTGLICDTSKEVLFTQTEAVVVPAGALSRFLGSLKKLATYKRKGGLYVAKMKIRKRVNPSSAAAAPFGRQGSNR